MKKVLSVAVAVVAVIVVLVVATNYNHETITTAQITADQGTIATARARGQKTDFIQEQGFKFNLACITHTEECAEIIARAEKNPKLKEVFLETKAAGVMIMPDNSTYLGSLAGKVGSGYILINTQVSDEKIIAFLSAK